jgi:methylase of polypeptide subunit release factors
MTILEVGCGVGNLVLPLLEETRHMFYACDFSPRAIDLLKVRTVCMPCM